MNDTLEIQINGQFLTAEEMKTFFKDNPHVLAAFSDVIAERKYQTVSVSYQCVKCDTAVIFTVPTKRALLNVIEHHTTNEDKFICDKCWGRCGRFI